ncbi:hypothetical protein H0H93_008824 [Arthromyces matolae]|nr:hypothetical protein H0H93_008824 [Arthromyces matolae]
MPATPSVSTKDASARQTPFTLEYDKLVIAVGAYSQSDVSSQLKKRLSLTNRDPAFNIPGVKENALFLKDVKDARIIHSRILECFEQANQPTVSAEERQKLLNFCIVGKSFDWCFLRGSHIFGKLHVEEQGEVPFGLLVWSTGLSPNPLVDSIAEVKKHNSIGLVFSITSLNAYIEHQWRFVRLLTNEYLNAINEDGTISEDVWVVGDCGSIDGEPLPATAQVAAQKGIYLAKALNKIANGQVLSKGFEFKNLGSLAYIGDCTLHQTDVASRKAIYDRPGSDGFLSKESGRLAWLLWRSAYFTMTLSVKNK